MEYKVIKINNIEFAKQIKSLFKDLHWANGRTIKDIEHQIKNSINVGIAHNNELIAYARAISDYKFISTIVDVVVKEQYREKGFGKELLKELIEHPTLKSVKQHELYCKNYNLKFYEKLGFKLKKDLNFMRLTKE